MAEDIRYTIGADTSKYDRAMRSVSAKGDETAGLLKKAFGVLGAAIAVDRIYAAGDAIFDAGKKAAQAEKAFIAITGSSEAAQREFEFLRTTADKLGQNFYNLQDSYKGIAAAARGTELEGQATREIFESITAAGASLGLSNEDVGGSLKAIEQMMSKGKVTAEELRGQLGERLPGAFGLMAEAMGVSTAKLDDMLKKGEVLAADALPKLAEVLRSRYTGEVDAATRASNKMAEAWTDLKVNMSQGGFLDSVSEAMMQISTTLKDPNVQQGMKDLAKNMGEFVSWVAGLTKYAGLRSITTTFGEGMEMANAGKFKATDFAKASFVERQKMVDDAKAQEQKQFAHEDYRLGMVQSGKQIPAPMSEVAPPSTPGGGGENDPEAMKAVIREMDEFKLEQLALYDEAERAILDEAAVLEQERKDAAMRSAQVETDFYISEMDRRYRAEEDRIRMRAEMQKKGAQNFISDTKFAFSVFGKESKTAFAAFKAVAIAEATIKTIEAAQSAFAAGMSVGGPYAPAIAVAYAAAAIAAGMARISQISSLEPGGSSAGSASAGGAVGTYSADPTTGLPETDPAYAAEDKKGGLYITIEGDFIGDDQYIDKLVDRINDASDRDVYVNSSRFAGSLQ